jgi:archaemetzincin
MKKPYLYVCEIGCPSIDKSYLKQEIENVFGLKVVFLQKYEHPSYAFDSRRHQYLTYRIIKELLTQEPKDAHKILGITDVDLCTPVLEYVFGEAQMNGKVAIISTYRLRQEFYHHPADEDLLSLRIKKVIMHEIGHCFGMYHCDDNECAMYLANNIFTLDCKKAYFCPRCNDFLKTRILKECYGTI